MVEAKKSLGQNFLEDTSYIERILDAALLGAGEVALEIGPGLGALTFLLTERAGQVIAVETDPRFTEILLGENKKNLTLIEGNILDLDLDTLLASKNIQTKTYSVIANIPYYITAPIIRRLLALHIQPRQIILMVQDEVAERLTAKPGSMSLLSVMAQYSATVEKLFFVPRSAFSPVPKVDSAVIKITPRSLVDAKEEKSFFRIVKAGFQAKRKTLVNNLANLTGKSKEALEQILTQLQLRTDIRAQALSI
ncbi:MAG: 16S rRNA (adenine(1518)-N(6)/adenine(1519)-N(6))-dimethyltransferase RsmA, partial [Patescibacteria group bacterium]